MALLWSEVRTVKSYLTLILNNMIIKHSKGEEVKKNVYWFKLNIWYGEINGHNKIKDQGKGTIYSTKQKSKDPKTCRVDQTVLKLYTINDSSNVLDNSRR